MTFKAHPPRPEELLVTVFPVNAPPILAVLVLGIVVVLIIVGAVLVIFSLVGKQKKRMQILSAGIVMLIAGAGVFFVSYPSQQNSVAVGKGSVLVSASPYFNLNVSAGQISRAYVINLSSWNVTITSRTDGSALGSFLSGFFTLSNGAKADVLTTQDTNLVVVLDSGTYLILGPPDFQSFLNSFSQSVMQVSGGPAAQPS
jgi:uncharacterized membrane protein